MEPSEDAESANARAEDERWRARIYKDFPGRFPASIPRSKAMYDLACQSPWGSIHYVANRCPTWEDGDAEADDHFSRLSVRLYEDSYRRVDFSTIVLPLAVWHCVPHERIGRVWVIFDAGDEAREKVRDALRALLDHSERHSYKVVTDEEILVDDEKTCDRTSIVFASSGSVSLKKAWKDPPDVVFWVLGKFERIDYHPRLKVLGDGISEDVKFFFTKVFVPLSTSLPCYLCAFDGDSQTIQRFDLEKCTDLRPEEKFFFC